MPRSSDPADAAQGVPWPAVWALVAVQVLFGGLSVAGTVAFRGLPPLGLAALRVATAGLVIWGLHALFVRERVARRDLPRLALYSLFGIVGNQILFMVGLSRTEPVAATVLVTTIPVFTLLVAVLLGVERAGWRKVLGILFAFAGVLVMVGAGTAAFGAEHAVGNLLVTLNALSYALYLVLARDILRVYRPLTVAAWTFTFGALVIVPLGALDLAGVAWGSLDRDVWWAFAYVVLGATVATYLLNNWALTKTSSSNVAVYIYLQPVVAAALAYWVFGTLPTGRTVAGAALIFVGVYFAVIARKRLPSFGRVRV